MDGKAFDRPGARRVMPIRDARSLGIATAFAQADGAVDASPNDPHRNHFLNRTSEGATHVS
jgi:hypothetical protein